MECDRVFFVGPWKVRCVAFPPKQQQLSVERAVALDTFKVITVRYGTTMGSKLYVPCYSVGFSWLVASLHEEEEA